MLIECRSRHRIIGDGRAFGQISIVLSGYDRQFGVRAVGYDSSGSLNVDICMEIAPNITVDPAICGGSPCLAGTRIPVSIVISESVCTFV